MSHYLCVKNIGLLLHGHCSSSRRGREWYFHPFIALGEWGLVIHTCAYIQAHMPPRSNWASRPGWTVFPENGVVARCSKSSRLWATGLHMLVVELALHITQRRQSQLIASQDIRNCPRNFQCYTISFAVAW